MSRKNSISDVFQNINMHKGNSHECWEWTGKINKKDGRPYFTVEGKRRPSYSYVLEAFKGQAPNGRMVLHSCDNQLCCNPHHMRWGTHQENMNDMKDRERHGLPKIVVRAIKTLLNDGNQTHDDIAKLYGVSREAITGINNGRSHKGVDEEE